MTLPTDLREFFESLISNDVERSRRHTRKMGISRHTRKMGIKGLVRGKRLELLRFVGTTTSR